MRKSEEENNPASKFSIRNPTGLEGTGGLQSHQVMKIRTQLTGMENNSQKKTLSILVVLKMATFPEMPFGGEGYYNLHSP